MFEFGDRSLQRLDTIDNDLQKIMFELIQIMDVTILEGHRNEDRQNQLFHEGKSQLEWPHSLHNSMPSRAVDVAPYPIDWNDLDRFILMVGIIKGIAHTHNIKIRCGLDWDSDNNLGNNRFIDAPHIELI